MRITERNREALRQIVQTEEREGITVQASREWLACVGMTLLCKGLIEWDTDDELESRGLVDVWLTPAGEIAARGTVPAYDPKWFRQLTTEGLITKEGERRGLKWLASNPQE